MTIAIPGKNCCPDCGDTSHTTPDPLKCAQFRAAQIPMNRAAYDADPKLMRANLRAKFPDKTEAELDEWIDRDMFEKIADLIDPSSL